MPNIMQLKNDAKELFDRLDELEPDQFLAELEIISQKGMQVIAPLCDLIDELNARGEARKAKASELMDLATNDVARAKTIKQSIAKIMSMLNLKKVENGALTVTLVPGNPALEILDETVIPLSYVKATITIPATQLEFAKQVLDNIEKVSMAVDKNAIKKDITDDFGIAGTQITRTPYVKIKG